MSESSNNSYRRNCPSYLRFDNQQQCRICGRPLQILVVGPKSENFQKLYYACPVHRFQAWCYPINEGEIQGQGDGQWKGSDEWKNKYKKLKKEYKIIVQEYKIIGHECKSLKFGLAVMIVIVSFLCFLIVRRS